MLRLAEIAFGPNGPAKWASIATDIGLANEQKARFLPGAQPRCACW
jgi:hypothetical protein